jgi:S1-C subfamily serine protease
MKHSVRVLSIGLVLMLLLLACRIETGLPDTNSPVLVPTLIVAPTTIPGPAVGTVPQVNASGSVLSEQDALVALYQRVSPGVVAVRVLSAQVDGLGSGFVIDTQGHIVTNYHVVEGVTDLEVDFQSGYKVRGSVLATDLDSDLAVLQVDVPAEQLTPLVFGDSDQVQVGQTVVAIGNPFGLNGTMTVGIVSSKGRTLDSLRQSASGAYFTAGGIIQTDAAINPGNSGGPLLNLQGEVIGVNRAIQTTSSTATGEPTNSGIGFSVSSNIVKRVVPHLVAEGKYDYPYLGISSAELITLLQAEALGLPQATGVYVFEVTPGSPADKAGLRGGTRLSSVGGLYAGGDLITAIDGQEVKTFSDMLNDLFSNKSPGDQVTFTIIRDGKQMEVQLTLDKRP